MNDMVERHCKKCLGYQAVTPATTKPPVKTTTMPAKSWRDLAVDLMGPLPTGESLLMSLSIVITGGLRWMLFETQLVVASSSV